MARCSRCTGLPLLLGSLLIGCGETPAEGNGVTPVPTSIVVDPAEFFGAVPCVYGDGALASYVATITDETICPDDKTACSQGSDCCSGVCVATPAANPKDPVLDNQPKGTCAPKSEPFVLPSSPAVSCAASVFFRFVIPGHTYSAVIDAYAATPESLIPVGPPYPDGAPASIWSGNRQMLDRETLTPAPPQQTTTCGATPETRATAIVDSNVVVEGCAAL
jgi:hypothetical protein